MGIYAVGRIEFADLYPQEDPEVRKHLIDAKVFLNCQRQLNNLSIQENRLRRQRDKDTISLQKLQEDRKREERTRLTAAAQQYIAVHKEQHMDWEPAENGFEFSIEQIETRALEMEPKLFAKWAAGKAA